MKYIFVRSCISISLLIISANGQSCSVDDWNYRPDIPDDFDNDLLIDEKEAFNVAFVEISYSISEGGLYSFVKTNSTGQFISVYIRKSLRRRLDETRYGRIEFRIGLRCNDGSFVPAEMSNAIFLTDANNRSPEFSSPGYTFFVQLPWPPAIPITLSNEVLVRDCDYDIDNAQVTVSLGRPDLLTISTIALINSDYSYDYKVDLFTTGSLTVGNYSFSLEANDGIHSSVVPIRLVVTEALCKVHLKDPVFGIKDKITHIIYKAAYNEFSKIGDKLILQNGIEKVEAYDPDELCQVDLTLNVDFLEINYNGEILVTRILEQDEIKNLQPVIFAEITANERGTGNSHRVPLVIVIT